MKSDLQDLFFRRRSPMPVILSSEVSECGLACLAMVASHHGQETDLNTLRQRFSVSISGMSLRGLMQVADQLQLSGRPLRVELGALERIQVPAILHWDMDHYVVLKSISRKHAVLHDPMRGEVKVTLAELSDHFTGVIVELSPASDFKKSRNTIRFGISDFVERVSGHRRAITYVVTLTIALQLLSLVLPMQMQLVIDNGIAAGDLNVVMVIAIAFGALVCLNALIGTLRDWTLQLLGSQVVFQVAGNLFRRLLRLSSSFFEKRHLGDILSRLGSVRQIQESLTQGMLSAVVDGPMILLAGVAMMLYSPQIAAIVFVTVLLYAVMTLISYPIIRAQTEQSIAASAVEQSYLMESIRGIVAIKVMNGEVIRESVWRNLYARSFNQAVGLVRIRQKTRFAEELLFGLQQILILYVAASLIINQRGLTVGMLFSLLAFRNIFTERCTSLIRVLLQFRMVSLYVQRLGDFLLEPPEADATFASDERAPVPIAFQDVAFRYGATDPLVLNGINLEIMPGEFIAITGRTGGGKTTFLKLLLGLRSPTQGMITFNGQRADNWGWQAFRSIVGVVRQDDQLFSGSLADNIAFFDPEMDMGKVRRAAEQALIHADIDRMPAKYWTLVGDMGSNLSGGQKQRLLLARALYRSPKILILDEGTANLDPATEDQLADMISNLEMTRIVVAHRPSLVERAERVVNVENGKIVLVRGPKAAPVPIPAPVVHSLTA